MPKFFCPACSFSHTTSGEMIVHSISGIGITCTRCRALISFVPDTNGFTKEEIKDRTTLAKRLVSRSIHLVKSTTKRNLRKA